MDDICRTIIEKVEAAMLREQIINFLQAAVIFLLITNALSIAATAFAIQLLNGVTGAKQGPGLLERKLNAILQRAA
jgi:hypothetical protein